jgi:hypothetical protein
MISLKNKQGQHEINRVFAWYGALILAIGFLKEAWSRSLSGSDYIGFGIGLAACYVPSAAVKLIKAVGSWGAPAGQPQPDATIGPGGAD